MPLIETFDLGRHYGARRGISDVNLSIHEGQVFGFLGPNGAGKTTTIRILLGFLQPNRGKATILGRDCWKESAWIKRDVGYVPGDVRLYPWLNARRGLRIVSRVRKRDLLKVGLQLCERFSLEPDLAIRRMSRGNRQKVALVLALAHRPKVVILDEPTPGLDPTNQLGLMRLLREMAAEGSTVLFSSHTLSEVEQICDQVAMIKSGRIVVDESLSELKRKAPRTVHVTIRDDLSTEQIRWPDELQVVSLGRNQAELRLVGSSVELLRWAAQQPLADLIVGQPSLDTLFRSYYDSE